MKARCDRRVEPQEPGAKRVTPRDLLLLRLLARCQPLTAAQVQHFWECSADTAWRRMRALRDQKLIKVVLGASVNEPNYYLLAPRAQPLLADTFGRTEEAYPVRRTLPRQLDHHLAVADAFIAVTVATSRSKTTTLIEAILDWEIRGRLGVDREDVQLPDLVVVLEGEDGKRMAVAVEVDRSSIRAGAMASRMVGYAQAFHRGQPLRGCPLWRVLLLVPGARRRNLLMAEFGEVADLPGGFIYFGIQGEEVTSRTVLSPALWRVQRLGQDGVLRWPQEDPFAPIRTTPQNRSDTSTPQTAASDANSRVSPRSGDPSSGRDPQ